MFCILLPLINRNHMEDKVLNLNWKHIEIKIEHSYQSYFQFSKSFVHLNFMII